ncbi:pentapeptide repeat-containing protein [Rhodococcus qingshengii]|uniref:pentapeptide repeat-containing protein n=1 Tax=Rhodococcus qingshengii TaxID=334542 RepID=UPI001C8B6916|nr:pentapeptide repeat-containing protein [Rhodococcus qingshengii]MBX9151985.1 hypothetical protein [Rhodococcus qingshengii]
MTVAMWQLLTRIEYSQDRTSGGDLVRAALTVAGLVGATVALVVAYRRQRDAEASRFVERFGAAAAQLGDPDPAVRLAGVYAISSVADETDSPIFRQQCIDVLCGYLRMPHETVEGMPSIVERSRKTTGSPDDSSDTGEVETTDLQRFRHHDAEVRKSIVRVICEHLQQDAAPSWSEFRVDLTGATLESANFAGCIFKEKAHFANVIFLGTTYFNGAHFHEGAIFVESTFKGPANFVSRNIDGTEPTVFHSHVSFDGTNFETGVGWIGTQFLSTVSLSATPRANIHIPIDRRTTFTAGAIFKDVKFAGKVVCHHAQIQKHLKVENVTFEAEASFAGSVVAESTAFINSSFHDRALFMDCEFQGVVEFRTIEFMRGANFSATTFNAPTVFDDWSSAYETSFVECKFVGMTSFGGNGPKWHQLVMPWNHVPPELFDLMPPEKQPKTVKPYPWPGPKDRDEMYAQRSAEKRD